MDFLSLTEVQQSRSEILDKVEALRDVASDENRDLSVDEKDAIDKLFAKHEAMQADEDRARKFEEKLAARTQMREGGPAGGQVNAGLDTNQQRQSARVIAPRLRNFEGPDALRDAEDSGYFLRAVLLGDQDARDECDRRGIDYRLDAQTVDDTARGGALVPTPLSSTIINVRNKVGVAARICRPWPMSGETDSVPKQTAGPTVYGKGEEAAATSSETLWTNVPLAVSDKYTLTKISRKLMRANVVRLADHIAGEFGHAFANQDDNELVNGDGNAGAPYWGETGLLAALGAAGKEVATGAGWAGIVLPDFARLVGILPEKYHDRAGFLMSRTFWSTVVEPLFEAAGGNTKSNLSDATRPVFKGYPVELTDKMPRVSASSQTCCLFGSFYDSVLLGEREGIEIATSTDRYFEEDQIGIRGHKAGDIQVHEGGDGSTEGGYVGLVTG